MKKELWQEAINMLDYDLVEEFFLLDSELEAERQKRKRRNTVILKLTAVAACIALLFTVYPTVKYFTSKTNIKYDPILITYSSLAEMEAALGFETLFSKPELGIMGMSVLYESKDGKNADTERPISLAAVSMLSDGYSMRMILYNIVFGVDDIDDLKEKNFEKKSEINGITVYESIDDDGEVPISLSAFEYDGNIYTVEMPITQDGFTVSGFLKLYIL